MGERARGGAFWEYMGFLGWEFTKEKKSVCGKRLEISYRRKGQDTQRGGRVKIACVFIAG
jgi:uncharacterized protein YcnI